MRRPYGCNTREYCLFLCFVVLLLRCMSVGIRVWLFRELAYFLEEHTRGDHDRLVPIL